MHPERLLTRSLREMPNGMGIARVLAAALAAVEPEAAVRSHMRREGDTLIVAGRSYDLSRYRRVLLISFGKAAAPMARAAAEILGASLAAGLIVAKAAPAKAPGLHPHTGTASLPLIEAGHPIPDERSAAAGRQVAGLLEQAGERDLVLLLVSGGGSALLTLPAPAIALDDVQGLTRALLASGASIGEINTLRKHLDLVKGGGLARMAHPAPLVALVLSDVVGSPLDVIASGPAVADTTTFDDAWGVLERFNLTESAPRPIVERLRRGLAGEVAETPKPGDAALEAVQHVIVGSNPQAAQAALKQARSEGYGTMLLTTYLQGEAREAGRMLAAVARELVASGNPLPRPACIVAGGETTVTLRGNGKGGRNQELVLAAVAEMAGLERAALVTLATDGDDGPTDAAGAVVTGTTLARAQAQGLSWEASLARNDAYPFFEALGDLLQPGLTQTNVNDLAFIFAW